MIPSGLRTSLRHLSVLPVGRGGREASRPASRSLAWFPVVGLLIGAPVCLVLYSPVPPLPRAAAALALWIGLTGGLHEDGLMDSADAAFAVVPVERRLEILKDPRAGAHAVTAAVLLLLLRFAALAVVPPPAVLVAAVAGRWLMTLTLAVVPPARSDGLGARFAAGARVLPPTLVALTLLGALSITAGPVRSVAAGMAALALGAAAAGFLARRFGGLTGDGHGAAGLLAEVGALYAFVPLTI